MASLWRRENGTSSSGKAWRGFHGGSWRMAAWHQIIMAARHHHLAPIALAAVAGRRQKRNVRSNNLIILSAWQRWRHGSAAATIMVSKRGGIGKRTAAKNNSSK